MRNQYMAKVLVHNKMVSEDQINAHWAKANAQKDIGLVLVEAGIITEGVYAKVLAFVKNIEAKNAASAPAPQESAPAAPAASAAPTTAPARSTVVSVPKASAAPKEPEQPAFQIEGNNPYGDSVSSSGVEVETIAGLETTSMGTVQVESETDVNEEDEGKLPRRFALATGEGTPVEAPETIRPMTNLSQLIAFARKFNATDIYLFAGRPVVMRQSGVLFVASEQPLDLSRISDRLNEASKGFSDGYKVVVGKNFSKTIGLPGVGRARVTVTWDDTTPSISVRVIPSESTSIDSLYLPAFCNRFTELNSGLVLIAGPSASGRSTTMTTFAETIAANRNVYIQTVEKPIERILQNPNGAIAQREVGLHVHTGLEGISLAMQSGADVILFDHVESYEELSALLNAANAGALVFAVASGNNVHSLLSRLMSSVPEKNRIAFANTLADQLKGIVVQHLVPVVQNQGQVLAVEAVRVTSPIANLIRRGSVAQIPAAISSQKDQGITLDDSLQKCVESGYIDGMEAWKRSCDSRRFAFYRPAK